MPKPKKSTVKSKKQITISKSVKKSNVKKKVLSKATALKVVKTKKAVKTKIAPKLVNKRKDPIKVNSKKDSKQSPNQDIPNTTIALLAVLTLVFVVWSAAVFFANVNYPLSKAPTMESASNLEQGAVIGLRIVPEPKSTATIGLTILDSGQIDTFTYENNS
jgi:hypothetical protein